MKNTLKLYIFFFFFTLISCNEENPVSPLVSINFIDSSTQKISIGEVSFLMKYVEAGDFYMGVQNDDPNGINYDENVGYFESPVHKVTLTKDFWMCETEVTQELWLAVMGDAADKITASLQQPVYYITWLEVQEFIERLNRMTGKSFRLPTEAEWEYAARGGQKSKHYIYSGSNNPDEVAWYKNNLQCTAYKEVPQIVATYKPNELGLYDMSGNVWEYCSDYLGRYSSEPVIDPIGFRDESCAIRGGCFFDEPFDIRLAKRGDCSLYKNWHKNIGFRLIMYDKL